MTQFDIKPPKTSRRDLEKYLASRAKLTNLAQNGKIRLERYIPACKHLENNYFGKIHPEDCFIFNDEKEFSDFLAYLTSRNPKNKGLYEWTLNHEREHYEAVVNEPGVRARYCFWILREDDGDTSGLPAILTESLKDADHYLKIRQKSIEAATEASPGDKFEMEGNTKGHF